MISLLVFRPFSRQILITGTSVFLMLVQLSIPHLVLASDFTNETALLATDFTQRELILGETQETHLFFPDVPAKKPDLRLRARISAYTSTPGQTDSTPFIAASGKRVFDGMIAANGLPFGTIVKIPSLYGNKEFVVEDRMNERYPLGHMDIWLDTTQSEARRFGVKRVEVEIYYPEHPRYRYMAQK